MTQSFKHTLAFCLFSLACSLGAQSLSAHPVTFEGGTSVSLVNQRGLSLWHANYSVNARAALGLDYMLLGEGGDATRIGLARLNLLLKRWLGRGSQGNLYLLTGLGGGYSDTSAERGGRAPWPMWMTGVQADYETQRVYTALIARALGDRDPSIRELSYHALYRFGAAPYVARSSELQAWLVAQLSYHSEMSGPPPLTLLMRVFHRSALWELGADTEGRPWLQLMAHF